jgi:hypothetical protein
MHRDNAKLKKWQFLLPGVRHSAGRWIAVPWVVVLDVLAQAAQFLVNYFIQIAMPVFRLQESTEST